MTIIDMGKVDLACQNAGVNERTGNIKEHEDSNRLFPHENYLPWASTEFRAYGIR